MPARSGAWTVIGAVEDHAGDLRTVGADRGCVSTAMNTMEKVLVTRGRPNLSAWSPSVALTDPLIDGVARLAEERDVVVIGSTSAVREIVAVDAVDECRLLTFPTVVGSGARLFTRKQDLELTSVDAVGPATLTTDAVRPTATDSGQTSDGGSVTASTSAADRSHAPIGGWPQPRHWQFCQMSGRRTAQVSRLAAQGASTGSV